MSSGLQFGFRRGLRLRLSSPAGEVARARVSEMVTAARSPPPGLQFRVPDLGVLEGLEIADSAQVAIDLAALVLGRGRMLGHLPGELVPVPLLGLHELGGLDRLLRGHGSASGSGPGSASGSETGSASGSGSPAWASFLQIWQ